MKDSFILEGKKFISAKRASEISDYSSDYIGQLCREEKLECRTIGHSWFVTEESLHIHKANVLRDELTRNRADNFRGGSNADRGMQNVGGAGNGNKGFKTKKALRDGVAYFSGKKYISAKHACEISDYSSDYVGQLCRQKKLECKMVGRAWFVTEESLHIHKASVLHDEVSRNRIENLDSAKKESALKLLKEASVSNIGVASSVNVANAVKALPAVNGEPEIKVQPAAAQSYALSAVSAKMVREEVRDEAKKISRDVILARVLKGGAVVAVFAGIIFVSSWFLQGPVTFTSSVSEEAGIFSAMRSLIASLFADKPRLTMNDNESADISYAPYSENVNFEDDSVNNGLVIAPATGSSEADEDVKNMIRSSFSDDVEISVDGSGTAGLIKPVFRNTTGKDFIYVMVPVKDDSSP